MSKIAGYSFIELVISLTILSILMVSGINLFSNIKISDNINSTKNKLAIIEKSLQNFVSINGFLPCPALINRDKSDLSYGDSSGIYDENLHQCIDNNKSLENETGIIPVRQLKLDDNYIYDGWGRKFAYRIATGFGSKNDFSKEGLDNFTGDIKIIDLEGRELTNINDDYPKNFGAAYVIISYGANGKGAWSNDSNSNAKIDSDSIESINNDHSNKIYIDDKMRRDYDDIILYKQKNELVNLAYSESPLNLSEITCNNAQLITEKGINNINFAQLNNINSAILGPINSQVLSSANAINNLCNNQKQADCNFTPLDLGSNLLTWLTFDSPYINSPNPADATYMTYMDNKANILTKTDNIIRNFSIYAVTGYYGVSNKPVYRNSTPFTNNKAAIYFDNTSFFLTQEMVGHNIGPAYNIFMIATYYDKASMIFLNIEDNDSSGMSEYNGFSIYNNHIENTQLSYPYYNIYIKNFGTKINSLGFKSNEFKDGEPILITAKIDNKNDKNILYRTLKLRNSAGLIHEISLQDPAKSWTTPSGINLYISPLMIDPASGSRRYKGYFGELIIYNGELTNDKILSVENYLLKKWFSGECK